MGLGPPGPLAPGPLPYGGMGFHFLANGPRRAPVTILLAHGAGAPMDSPFMEAMAALLAARNLRTVRFEFAYMAARRQGARRPPPRAESLMGECEAAVSELRAEGPLIVGGKSLGGRVASLVAQAQSDAGRAAGLLCLGYPFHPPGAPDRLRTAHLMHLRLPTLICQGTRDPFGTRDEVEALGLPPAVRLHWAEDGDHDLKPRKASGLTARGNWSMAADAIAGWATLR